MHEIDAHSIQILEFPKVRDIIAGLTLSPYGKERVLGLRPLFDRESIERLLRESAQMRDIIRFEEAMPLERIDDISEAVGKARVEGVHLDPKDLLKIKDVLSMIASLSGYGKIEERQEKFPDIVEILKRLRPQREIVHAIDKAIENSGDISDRASSALGHIRRDMGDVGARIKQQLNKILSAKQKHAGWQDDVITIREGRFVIPVLSSEFKNTEGIVHDKSQSGATLFVEPSTVIEANNKLRTLQQDERLEIDRILRELTAMVGGAADIIMSDLQTVGSLDAAHARAGFALKIDGEKPNISSDCKLDLIDARHPLLLYAMQSAKDVVPLSLQLDRDNQAILITGPNTGGKTVALKTIGLLTLMAMAGIEIPADHKSTIGIYRKVYADIGDEQSLELSLSTFSSHIRNIIAAVQDADEQSLVLFDEIGAGTDPKEGAALAEIIIITLLERSCNLIATTHYSQLKTLPLEYPGLVNASLEFDRKNLQPTFRLLTGLPGASYAIDIALRLGLPDDMADRAAVILGQEEKSLDSLIEKLDSDLKNLHNGRKELEERLNRAQMLEEFYKSRQEKLETREKELIEEFAAKYEDQLRQARKEMNQAIKEIRESQAASAKIKEAHNQLENQAGQIGDIRSSLKGKNKDDGGALTKGDVVWINKFNTEAEVVEMVSDKKVRVAVGKAFMVVDTIDLKRLDNKNKTKTPQSKSFTGVRASAAEGDFNPEIMLRGFTVEEALEKLDKFLDDAVLAGLGQVYIVHGKGTGTLRKRLSEYLKKHKAVSSIRIGDWNEGGTGVTIARLKI